MASLLLAKSTSQFLLTSDAEIWQKPHLYTFNISWLIDIS